MFLNRFKFRSPGFLFSLIERNGHSIYPEEEFKKLIRREQARADRGGKEFSIVVFDLKSRDKNKGLYTNLIKRISQRIRLTDDIGWFDSKHPAVLLVDVRVKDAWNVALDIKRSISREGTQIGFRIFSYPSDMFSNNDSGRFSKNGSGRALSEIPGEDAPSFRRPESGNPDLLFTPSLPLWKRSIDIIISSIAILICFPLGLLAGLMIKTVSPGPVFFRQERLGFRGKPFMLWKFRSMDAKADCEQHRGYVCNLIKTDQPMKKLDCNDVQIIPLIGKPLRASCIDELPQLINVLLGEMSLVGPRPCISYEYDQYLPWQRRRILSVPGITGLWQVSGKNRTTFREMIGLDLIYERQKSLWFDLKILVKTVWVVLDQAFSQNSMKKEGSDAAFL